eukprot:TRINITY_DN14971_c0_g1_i1.p1 TRINITY_DN14971_c0_g1~~TRINITY_DN14971_c0_g1_i1.p1  ORF type:complete len:355 (-),score=68.05 TRINITY_DN14971_c0_g1_i1:86-1108(-)
MAMRLPSPTPIRGLLRCLDSSFFIASFEEEGYRTVGDMREDGRETVEGFVSALGMARGADDRLLDLSFQEDDVDDSHGNGGDTKAEDLAVARCSGCFDPVWLETISPLYSMHMGCENMGPLLYSLLRFMKPKCCLEIGAGYTSIFLLQALEDNAREAEAWSKWRASRTEESAKSWLADQKGDPDEGLLHCVDNFAHEHTTAPQVLRISKQLGLEKRLQLHLDDGRAFVEESKDVVPSFDFVWLDGLLDFAPPIEKDVKAGIDAFLALLWPRISPGGHVMLHSTLTNSSVRAWVEGVGNSPWGPPGASFSFLEPTKKFQNSCTILQKRSDGYSEPIYSKLP